MTKPILKWVGGKTQILDEVVSIFPIECNNYREIFVGGGSVLLRTLCMIRDVSFNVSGKVYAYDLNDTLIHMYRNIQSNHRDIYEILQTYIDKYDSFETLKGLNIESKEKYYYEKRNEYNKMSQEDKRSFTGSALFIFLNKTCFRGMYRTGPNGFNVPFGSYKNPEIVNLEHLTEVATLIKDVIFEVADFTVSISKAEKNDFIYLDPPYAPENSTSFVGYNREGFTEEQHTSLFTLYKNFASRGITGMMSNSNVALVRDSFKDYNLSVITCKRSINSKNPGAKAEEVLIKF